MASGFLILPDGRCYAVRWSLFDDVMRTVAIELSKNAESKVLHGWLTTKIPTVDDVEDMGAGMWLRSSDQELLNRKIDLRDLPVQDRLRFCEATKNASRVSVRDEMTSQGLSSLVGVIERYERCDPPLRKSEWYEVVIPEGATWMYPE